MTKWEYLIVQKQPTGVWATSATELNLGWGEEPEMLAKCGEQGWELAAANLGPGTAPTFHFKRPKVG
jgi:hypothetical protein